MKTTYYTETFTFETYPLDPKEFVLADTLRSFLAEDLGHGDLTTTALIDPRRKASGNVTCNEAAVIAGLEESLALLHQVGCTGSSAVKDGEKVKPGTNILEAEGPASTILTIERTLLNLLCHMSGVATATAELVDMGRKTGSQVTIACTRKTLPGLRYFEKKAVQLGGGDTHRLRLDDAVLIKDNHLALVGSVAECVKRARHRVSFTKKIEVEATKPEMAVEAAEAGADIILLDNMKPELVKHTVMLLENRRLRSKVLVEASGGITRENLVSYAKTGVDIISVGRVTHSARSIDMSLDLSPSS